ncbi:MAG: cytidine deaminase [Dysgonamonadaceae bacterium]|jgi:cytidine deaminase|nr:cytidine deaminase [Dysgonamonadaceae bacterium]
MKKLKIAAKVRKCTYEELSSGEKKLVDTAKNASGKAYAPYSGFRVGAAILLDNGVIVSGNNQENAAYPSGLCAERVAVFAAGAHHPCRAPLALAIAAQLEATFTDHPVSPCGACRQCLLEMERRHGKALRLILYGTKEVYIVDRAEDLLPLAFTQVQVNDKTQNRTDSSPLQMKPLSAPSNQ